MESTAAPLRCASRRSSPRLASRRARCEEEEARARAEELVRKVCMNDSDLIVLIASHLCARDVFALVRTRISYRTTLTQLMYKKACSEVNIPSVMTNMRAARYEIERAWMLFFAMVRCDHFVLRASPDDETVAVNYRNMHGLNLRGTHLRSHLYPPSFFPSGERLTVTTENDGREDGRATRAELNSMRIKLLRIFHPRARFCLDYDPRFPDEITVIDLPLDMPIVGHPSRREE